MIYPKFSEKSWTQMSEMSINTVKNIDEVEQICLLTSFTTKLHRYYRVTLHFLDFHKKISENFTSFCYPSPLY